MDVFLIFLKILPCINDVLATGVATPVNMYTSSMRFPHFSTLPQPIKEADTP